MIKILHAADLHLDAAFSGASPAAAAAFRAEQRALLRRLPEVCREQRCELVFLAGDLFNGSAVYTDTVECLCAALADCGVPVFIAPGNHDPLTAGSPYLAYRFPDNVHIFRRQRIEAVVLEELGCRVYGAGFETADVPSLLEGFRAEDDGLLNLMVLHGDPVSADSSYNPVTRAQLEQSGLRYVALGHVHTQGIVTAGRTTCAWPGCMAGHGFDETGEKGFFIVTVDGRRGDIAFVPSGARRYERLRVPAGDDALAALREALAGVPADSVVRAELTGESDAPDLPALYRALEGTVFSLQLRDRTAPRPDLWTGAGEDTLKGSFLRIMREKYDAASTDEDRETVIFAVRAALALMEGREAPEL